MSYRKVLLLGNGINRAFSSDSCEDVIRKMAMEMNPGSHYAETGTRDSKLPFPLQAVIASNNEIEKYLKENKKDFFGCIENPNMRKMLRDILLLGFDDILTTNYSYELEIATTDEKTLSDKRLKKMVVTTRSDYRAEPKYFIRTFNNVTYKEKTNRIWHIHGAARNPTSMVIGHPYYGNLIFKYKEYFQSIRNAYLKNPTRNSSWLDSFVMSDVYVLGQSLSTSELDLWWLIDRKHCEKTPHGKIHYFAPKWERKDNLEKYALMNCYGIEICDSIDSKKIYGGAYQKFYESALKMISKRINEEK